MAPSASRIEARRVETSYPAGATERAAGKDPNIDNTHLAALAKLFEGGNGFSLNLGTGRGYSVLEMVRAFEQASGRPVPYRVAARRPGDIAVCYADPAKAFQLLGWRAKKGLAEMCEDHWRWQSMNPDGFGA